MQNKFVRSGGNLAEILIVVAILAGANFLSYKFFHRFDLTRTQQYTVSPSTKQLLREMDDPVDAEFFISRELPPEFQRLRDDTRDMLAEYSAYGRGNFRVRETDPGDDAEKKERATNLGVSEKEFQVLEKDQRVSKKGFFGLVLNFGDKTETLDTQELASIDNLEYLLTSRLVRLTLDAKPKIALFAGGININQQQGNTYNTFKNMLQGPEGLYEVVDIDPAKDRQLPEGLSSVFILGAFNMSDSLKYSVDQFLLNGGKVFVAIDPIMQTGGQMIGMGQAFPSLPTMEEELEKYGVKFDKKLIAEPGELSASLPVQQGFLQFALPYPLFPRFGPDNMNKEIGAIGQLEIATLVYGCPLTNAEVPGVKYTWLMHSSPNSFVVSSPFSLELQQDWKFLASSSEKKGPFDAMVMLSGDLPSAFPGGPPSPEPPPPPAEGEPAPPPAPEQLFDPTDQIKTAKPGAQLIVMSSASAFADNYMQVSREVQANLLLTANLADMLVLGDKLTNIRAKAVTDQPLKLLNDAQRSFIRFANVLGMPILLVLFGLLLWMLKQRRRLALQRHYGG